MMSVHTIEIDLGEIFACEILRILSAAHCVGDDNYA